AVRGVPPRRAKVLRVAEGPGGGRGGGARAASLVATQSPPLPERSLEFLGEGWDYTAFLVDETLVFRFPRRKIGVPGTEREIAKLPLLAPLLPVAVPRPVHLGRPSGDFPLPFHCA